MNGLNSLDEVPADVVIGLVQLQPPVIQARAVTMRQAKRVAPIVARRSAVPGNGARGRLQGRPGDAAHGRLHGADPRRLALSTRATFCNLMVTASVCMCGSDSTFDSVGEVMVCNFDGSVIAHGASGRADHEAVIRTVTMQGGVFGAVAPSAALLAAMQ